MGPVQGDVMDRGLRKLYAAAIERRTDALLDFIHTVEATGGVRPMGDGTFAPVGDLEWIDLGEAYVKACRACHRPVMLADDEEAGT
jgi:hypothetical protein